MPARTDLGRVRGVVNEARGGEPPFASSHPLGCHRRRVPDRTVFEHIVLALVHGSGYERIASRRDAPTAPSGAASNSGPSWA